MLNVKSLFSKSLTVAFMLALAPSALARLNPSDDPNLGSNGAGYLEQSAGQRSASSMDSLLGLAAALIGGSTGSFGQNSSSDALVGTDKHIRLSAAPSALETAEEAADDIEK